MGQMDGQHRLEMKTTGGISTLVGFIFEKKTLLFPSDCGCEVKPSN